jgi:hypothetical protein
MTMSGEGPILCEVHTGCYAIRKVVEADRSISGYSRILKMLGDGCYFIFTRPLRFENNYYNSQAGESAFPKEVTFGCLQCRSESEHESDGI